MNSGSKIQYCIADNGAVLGQKVEEANHQACTVDFTMNEGAEIKNCSSANGLLYTTSGTLSLNGVLYGKSGGEGDPAQNVISCTSTYGGVARVQGNGTFNVNGTIDGFTATNGGAVYVKDS